MLTPEQMEYIVMRFSVKELSDVLSEELLKRLCIRLDLNVGYYTSNEDFVKCIKHAISLKERSQRVSKIKEKYAIMREENARTLFEPFLLSDWKTNVFKKSKVWAYSSKTSLVKACVNEEDARSWDRNVRVLVYDSEESVEQVLRSMS